MKRKETQLLCMSLSAKSRNSRETRYSCDISSRILMRPQDVVAKQTRQALRAGITLDGFSWPKWLCWDVMSLRVKISTWGSNQAFVLDWQTCKLWINCKWQSTLACKRICRIALDSTAFRDLFSVRLQNPCCDICRKMLMLMMKSVWGR